MRGFLLQLEAVEMFGSILNVKVSNFVLITGIQKTAWECKCMQTLARCGSFVLICWYLSVGT